MIAEVRLFDDCSSPMAVRASNLAFGDLPFQVGE